MPATVPEQARTALTADTSPTAAQARIPVRTATAVAARNVTECSGGRAAFARRIISTTPVGLLPQDDRSGARPPSAVPGRGAMTPTAASSASITSGDRASKAPARHDAVRHWRDHPAGGFGCLEQHATTGDQLG